MQFHGSFGGPQTLRTSIQTICLSDVERKPVSDCYSQPAKSLKTHTGGVYFCLIGTQDAMPCHLVKNTLLQTVFSAILPAGLSPLSSRVSVLGRLLNVFFTVAVYLM